MVIGIIFYVAWFKVIPYVMEKNIPSITKSLERIGYENIEHVNTKPLMKRLVFKADNANEMIYWQFGKNGVSQEYPSPGCRLKYYRDDIKNK